MKKPIIGVTCSIEEKEDRERKYPVIYPFDYLKRQYYFAIENAGGVPILLPNLKELSLIEEILKLVDGILISGGYDVHPKYYGEKLEHKSVKLTPDRDKFDLKLVKKARDRKIPILGICRGHQLINIAFGGTLYQDLSLRDEPTFDHKGSKIINYKKRHRVIIKEDSKLFSIIGKKEIVVNTSHHQLIKKIAPGFAATAWSKEDGVIEAIESIKDNYLLSVQWHPEVDFEKKNSKLIFKSLIENARQK
ncbi:MAG TPA: gamma-glutamyl-gamma-aminobutyrate hydrolase family protein [candidate division Zixibacteria bacterium]|jgi:putative glutamine amidotransferase